MHPNFARPAALANTTANPGRQGHPVFCKGGPFSSSARYIPDQSLRRLNRLTVSPPQIAVQPLISTIPCKLLNILANLMLKSFMFASQTSPSSDSHNDFPYLPLPSANSVPSALKSPRKNTSAPPLKQKPSPRALFSLFPQNSDKLNPSFSNSCALFRKECSHNSFPIYNFRTLLQNTRGEGLLLQPKFLSRLAFTATPFRIRSFAHRIPLTPIESHSCKKQGRGKGLSYPLAALPLCPPRHAQQRPQLAENTATLDSVSANFDAASSISPLFATLTKNTRGGGPNFEFPFSNFALSPFDHGTISPLPRLHRCGGKFYA